MNKIGLSTDSFGDAERAAVDAVMASGQYSMAGKVREFEQAFAGSVGAKDALMVNSGSSANLLLVASLLYRSTQKGLLKPGDEVIVPALSWPTTVWPIAQLGLVPVFADINLDDLSFDLESCESILTPKTKAMFLIHVLGMAAPMAKIRSFCEAHQLHLIEDCCESYHSFSDEKHVGTFGLGGTFSHFFSHHLTTIEGGSIVSDDPEWMDDLRSLRAHGWVRDRTDKEEWQKKFPHLHPSFLFVMPGFNVRPTEIQAAIGLVQLKRMPELMRVRLETADFLVEQFATVPWLTVFGENKSRSLPYPENSWMNLAFGIKEDKNLDLQDVFRFFEQRGIEYRPIIAGNLTRHPAIQHIQSRQAADLKNADYIFAKGWMIGCPLGLTDSQKDCVHELVKDLSKL